MDVVELSMNQEILSKLQSLPDIYCPSLLQRALYELEFLKFFDTNRHLYYNEAFVDYSIIRYEKYWMPLLAKASKNSEEDLLLAPPLDIHWVWHVHMLAPVQYNDDSKTMAGREIGHELKPFQEFDKLRAKTKAIWEKEWPKVPFEVNFSHIESNPETLEKESSDITYGIKAAALRY